MTNEIDIQSRYWDAEAKSFQQIYSKKKSGFSNLLDSVFRKDMFQRFSFTLERSEPLAGRSVLDVGCGSGLYAVAFAKRGARHVTGIDIADNMLAMCRQAAADAGVSDRCAFEKGDLLAWHAPRQFDVTIGIGLFDYISEALPVLKRMHEVTTGRVIASFPRRWTWRAPVRKARLMMRGCPVHFYSRNDVARIMEEAGFARTEITVVGKLFCVVGHIRP